MRRPGGYQTENRKWHRHRGECGDRGCALCEAGAGLLMDIAPQLGRRQLEQLRDELGAWLAGNDDADIREEMGAFAPVRDIKNRHKCVTLAFEAGVKALSENN